MDNFTAALTSIVSNLTKRLERLEGNPYAATAGAVKPLLFAALPTATDVSPGSLIYVSDGRKDGEGAGLGTGVLAYSDGVAWRRASDDSTVAV